MTEKAHSGLGLTPRMRRVCEGLSDMDDKVAREALRLDIALAAATERAERYLRLVAKVDRVPSGAELLARGDYEQRGGNGRYTCRRHATGIERRCQESERELSALRERVRLTDREAAALGQCRRMGYLEREAEDTLTGQVCRALERIRKLDEEARYVATAESIAPQFEGIGAPGDPADTAQEPSPSRGSVFGGAWDVLHDGACGYCGLRHSINSRWCPQRMSIGQKPSPQCQRCDQPATRYDDDEELFLCASCKRDDRPDLYPCGKDQHIHTFEESRSDCERRQKAAREPSPPRCSVCQRGLCQIPDCTYSDSGPHHDMTGPLSPANDACRLACHKCGRPIYLGERTQVFFHCHTYDLAAVPGQDGCYRAADYPEATGRETMIQAQEDAEDALDTAGETNEP